MAAVSCEAVLLRWVDYGESDRIVHLLTSDAGRLTAIAKGARRSHRRFPGTLDVFNHLAIRGRINAHASMAFLEQAKLVDPFLGLRAETSRYALASFLAEMLDRLSPEGIVGTEAERIFIYATESFGLLAQVQPSATLRLLLELRARHDIRAHLETRRLRPRRHPIDRQQKHRHYERGVERDGEL